jgi:hypothetical protein
MSISNRLMGPTMNCFQPATCPHCEYDRRFPGFEAGGWMQQDNNGPIVSCPMCNDDGSFPIAAPITTAKLIPLKGALITLACLTVLSPVIAILSLVVDVPFQGWTP